MTRFTQILNSKSENLTLQPITEAGENISYGGTVDLKAVVLPWRAEEILLEPGYVASDYIVLHVFSPIRHGDLIRRNGADYEIITVQEFTFKNETAYYKAICRRFISQ